jgi:hypothetical protein
MRQKDEQQTYPLLQESVGVAIKNPWSTKYTSAIADQSVCPLKLWPNMVGISSAP